MVDHRGVRRLWIGSGVLCLAVAVASCGDDGSSTPPGGQCDGDTFAAKLSDPNPAVGFSPFETEITAQVSLIEQVSYTWTLDFGDGTNQTGSDAQPRALKLYEQPGNYEVALTVRDETCGGVVTDRVMVEVFPPVELEGEDLFGRPGNVSVGEDLNITLKVLNSSSADLRVPVDVDVYLSSRAGVLWEEVPGLIELTRQRIEPGGDGVSIAAGERTNIDVDVQVPSTVLTGSYFLIAAIDQNDDIGEGDNEGNNLLVSASPVFIDNELEGAPDLTVETVQVGPSSAFLRLSTISVNADIINRGMSFADNVRYAIYVQAGSNEFDPETAQRIFTSDPIPSLGFQGESNTFALRGSQINLPDPIVLPDGMTEMEVWTFVVADPDDEIAEGSPDDTEGLAEMNNVAVAINPIIINDQPEAGTDIVLLDFDFAPSATFLDGSVQITLEVANFGTDPTRSFFCGVYLSDDDSLETTDERLTNINISNIEPSDDPVSVVRTTVVPGFIPIGSYTAFAWCDPSNVVPETFEDNNTARFGEVTITPEAIIDLVPSMVVAAPLNIDDGGSFTVDLTVTNEGDNGAGPSQVRVIRSSDDTFTQGDEVIATLDVSPIDAGGSRELSIPIDPVSCDIFTGSYYLAVEIVTNDPEVNSANNTVELTEQLVIAGDRCDCTEDPFDDPPGNDTPSNCLPIAEGLTEDLAVCTGGNDDYYCVDLNVGDSVTVEMNMRHAGEGTNLDLRILDTNFQPIPTAVSRGDGLFEQADVFLVQEQGRYIIQVDGRTDDEVNEYDLDVSITSPGPGTDLTPANLVVNETNPTLGEQVTGSFRTLNIAEDDAGAYTVQVYLSADMEVDISDFLLQSIDVTGGLMGARSRMDDIDFIVPVDAAEGDYHVCVLVDANDDVVGENDEMNNLRCTADTIAVDTGCYDPFENNDEFTAATDLEPGMYENLNVCLDGRDDWYRVCADDGQQLEATVTFLHAMGDIDLELYLDAAADDVDELVQVATSAGVRDDESVLIDYVSGSTCYLLRVLQQDVNNDPDRKNDYMLDLRVEDGDPLLACDSVLEPNNTLQEAVATGSRLLDLANTGMSADRCPRTDTDVYYVDLAAGADVEICVENLDLGPDNPMTWPFSFVLSLLDPSQAQVSSDVGEAPCVSRSITVSGRYSLRVVSAEDFRSVRYTISVDGLTGVDVTPNDFQVQPTDIVPDETIVVYDFSLANIRNDPATNVVYQVFYSADPVIDPGTDLLLDTGVVSQLDGFEAVNIQDAFLVPNDASLMAGQGTIGVVVDPMGTIDEVNEMNNRGLASVNMLVCQDDVFGATSVTDYAPIPIGGVLEDMYLCPAAEDWICSEVNLETSSTYRFEVLFDSDVLSTDLNMQVYRRQSSASAVDPVGPELSIGDDSHIVFTTRASGTRRYCARVFGLTTQSQNNYSVRLVGPLSPTAGSDLEAQRLELDRPAASAGISDVEVDIDATNNGTDDVPFTIYEVYYSTDATIDTASDFLLGAGTISDLNSLALASDRMSVALPDDVAIPDGAGFIGVVLDPTDAISESDEGNNAISTPINVFRCTEDSFAGNQMLSSAVDIDPATSYSDLAVCPGSDDWYCYAAAATGTHTIDVGFSLVAGAEEFTDLDVEAVLVNGSGVVVEDLGAEVGVADDASLDVEVTAVGNDVCFRVYGADLEGTNMYTLDITTP